MKLALVLALVGGCKFELSFDGVATGDDADMELPDAPPCTAMSSVCASPDVLRVCDGASPTAVDTPCDWGCLDSPAPHCGVMTPGANVISTMDLDPTGLGPGVIPDTKFIDANTGEIKDVRPMGVGVKMGIAYEQRTNGVVFRFSQLTISGTIRLKGDRAIVLVADGPIQIDGIIDGRGDPVCGMEGRVAGPGGIDGADKEMPAGLPGGGSGTNTDQFGGGGGGHGGVGGIGGAGAISGGDAFGIDAIDQLIGGGGGGGAGGMGGTGTGGGGGAALQIVSNTSITIGAAGGINAGGCGAKQGDGGGDAGGGGGAGGTILLEAPRVMIAGALAVNGGGGGTRTNRGGNASLDRTPAPGGTNATDGDGGDGAAAKFVDGGTPLTGTRGGGGGAIGRIRVNTRKGVTTLEAGAVMSPAFDDMTTASESTAHIE